MMGVQGPYNPSTTSPAISGALADASAWRGCLGPDAAGEMEAETRKMTMAEQKRSWVSLCDARSI